jgi:hypothetical protein
MCSHFQRLCHETHPWLEVEGLEDARYEQQHTNTRVHGVHSIRIRDGFKLVHKLKEQKLLLSVCQEGQHICGGVVKDGERLWNVEIL